MSEGTATIDPTEALKINEGKLAEYLRGVVPAASGPMQCLLFSHGQSNPTYMVKFDDASYVVRKQPPGELLPSAHAIDREHRVQKALHPQGYPVAQQFHYCEDRTVIGTPFYVMEKMEGRVFSDSSMPGCDPEERRAMYLNMAETLAKLHSYDPEEIGLGTYGRPGSYYERQFRRWSRNFLETQTQDIPEMHKLMEWLPENMPEGDESRIAHGDYRVGNLMFHPTEPRIISVFDWEISTLGHPLSDLAYLSILYFTTEDEFQGIRGKDRAALGIPPFEEFIEHYRVAAGRPDTVGDAHLVHAMFRFAAILDGVRARGLAGNAASDDAATVGAQGAALARRAWEVVERASK
jgi:aminoglycoside phosphotransferase (APT) family kinase protein